MFAHQGAAEFTPVSLVAHTPVLATTSKMLTPMSTGEITARVEALPPSQPAGDPLRFTNLVSQLALPDPVDLALAPLPPSPAGSARSFAHSASSPVIDLSDANWHKRPDRPLVAADYSLAISAIQSGSALTMADFLARPPAVDAPPVASTPSLWDVTPRPASFLQKLDALAASFPRSAEDMLVTALSLNGESLTEASVWLGKESSRKADILALRDAFPEAETEVLLEALAKHGKSFTSAYWFLAGKYASSWGHASVAPRGTVGIMDLDSDSDDEFISATQSHHPVEDKWWDTFAQTRLFKIKDLPAASQWSPVCRVSMARTPLTPRVLGLIRDLGLLLKAPRDFQRGVGSLAAFPSPLTGGLATMPPLIRRRATTLWLALPSSSARAYWPLVHPHGWLRSSCRTPPPTCPCPPCSPCFQESTAPSAPPATPTLGSGAARRLWPPRLIGLPPRLEVAAPGAPAPLPDCLGLNPASTRLPLTEVSCASVALVSPWP